MGAGAVDLRHAPVGGPAGVGDAEGTGNLFWKDGFQVGHFSNRLVSSMVPSCSTATPVES